MIGKNTLRRILKKIAMFVVPKYYTSINEIGGNGMIVEVDESKFGKCKYNRGHHIDGVWVFGAVERSLERKIFLIAVQNRSSETLMNLMKTYINKNSTIFSDCWKGYNNVKNYFSNHLLVNHSKWFKDPISGVHTNTIEGNWRSIKYNVPPRCRTTNLVSLYLVKYMLIRNDKNLAFSNFIKLFF